MTVSASSHLKNEAAMQISSFRKPSSRAMIFAGVKTMVTLNIDETVFATWSKEAARRGMTVEEWLKAETLPELSGGAAVTERSTNPTAWHDRLMQFASRHQPTGASMDDSRETIYQDRGL